MDASEEASDQSAAEVKPARQRRSFVWWVARAAPPGVYFALMLLFLTTSFLSRWRNAQSFVSSVIWEISQLPHHWVYYYHYCYSSLTGMALSLLVMAVSWYHGRKICWHVFREVGMIRWWVFWIGCVALNWFLGSRFYQPTNISHAMLDMPWWGTLPYVGCNLHWVFGGTITVALVVRPWTFREKFGWVATANALIGLILLNHLFSSGLFVCIGPHGVE
ncbi:MAG: hypothetical protein N2C14_16160 [Planctomycetales bacterium]